MDTPWRPVVEIVNDGEQVSANVANRPLSQLSDQTTHLKQEVAKLSPSSGRLIYSQAPLDESVAALDWVYYDNDTATYKPAIAEAVQDSNGQFIAGPRSFVVGLVLAKSTSTQGDVLQFGRVNLDTDGINPNNLLEDPILAPFEPGRYFLSNKVAGKMTRDIRMPNIQVGFFTDAECHVQPLQKDLFEAHYHYRFPLVAKPAASQNFDRTGWTTLGASGAGAIKYVDYFNRESAETPPPMILCIRPSGQLPIDSDSPVRVELYNEGGILNFQLHSDIDYDDPTGGGGIVVTDTLPWPEYGEWVPIADTNLEVAFVRPDGVYSSSFEDDANIHLVSDVQRYRIYLPNDLYGWANANTLDDLVTPPGVLYRYLLESDSQLNSAWPPVPLESGIVELNGVSMHRDTDFKLTELGVWWITGDLVGDFSPWPSDYDATTGAVLDTSNGRNMNFHFTKSALHNSRSVVFSLKGVSPLKVTECPTGDPASTGHLQVAIDLNLLVDPAAPTAEAAALATVDGVSFKKTTVVSEIEPGNGIKIDRLTAGTTKNIGKVRISRSDLKFEGEFTSIALRNAKEVGTNPIYTYIDFLPATTSPCGITGSFRLPKEDIVPATLKLKILGAFRGDTAVLGGTTEQTALFKVVYHVLRPGFSTASMNDATAVAIQYWKVTFPPSYVAGTILSPEIPFDLVSPDLYQIDSTTLATFPNSLVALSGGFQAGDVFSVQIDRVRVDGIGNVDTYPGRVGALGFRWILP